MILELRKSCLQTIERALTNINQLKMQWLSSFAKAAQQKVNLIQNDLQLLKDNFTLIATKIVRLESKCSERQVLVQKVQHKYRSKYQELCEAYKILEVKHEKLGKQLNFIKFSNNNLRKQLHSVQNKSSEVERLRRGIQQIQKLILNNGQDLQSKINKIIVSIQTEGQPEIFSPQYASHKKLSQARQIDQKNPQSRFQQICQYSLETPALKQQAVLKQQKLVTNSCSLKEQKDIVRTKKKFQNNKQIQQIKESFSTDKKKRNQLAKIVEQQGRLAKINERYLSTDIF